MEKTVTESFIKARQVCCSHHPTHPTHPHTLTPSSQPTAAISGTPPTPTPTPTLGTPSTPIYLCPTLPARSLGFAR